MHNTLKYILITSIAYMSIGCSSKSTTANNPPIANAGEDKVFVSFSNDQKDYRVQEYELYFNQKEDNNVYIYELKDSEHIKPSQDELNITKQTLNLTLNADNSTDMDGDVLNYKWEIVQKPEGSNASLLHNTDKHPILQMDKAGNYKIKLIVNDSYVDSEASFVNIALKLKLLAKTSFTYNNTSIENIYKSYTFNNKNQITNVQISQIGNDINNSINQTIVYDKQGNMVSLEVNSSNGAWSKEYNSYDKNGNNIKHYYADSEEWFEDKNTTYENNHIIYTDLTNANFPNDIWHDTYIYDESYNIIRIEHSLDGNSWVSRFEYNEINQLIKGYYVNGNVNEYPTTYTYDDEGRLIEKYTTNEDSWSKITYTYNDNSTIKYTINYDGYWSRETSTYDEDGSIILYEEEYSDSQEDESTSYTYTLYP